jgi:hypothetical protein
MKILIISIIGDTSLITDRLTRESFENNDEYDFCSLSDSEIKRILAWPQRDPGLTFKPNGRKKSINGVCGIQTNGSIEFSEQGIQLFTELDGFIFGYLNKTVRAPRYVILSCNTTGLMSDKNIIQAVHQKDSPTLCNKYFDSVKVYDK